MFELLGEVIYWTCTLVALLPLAWILLYLNESGFRPEFFVLCGIMTGLSLVIWLFGRANLYLFAGR